MRRLKYLWRCVINDIVDGQRSGKDTADAIDLITI